MEATNKGQKMAGTLPQGPLFQLESTLSAATTLARKKVQVRTLTSRQRLVVTVAIVRVGGQRQLHSHVRRAVSTRGGLLAS